MSRSRHIPTTLPFYDSIEKRDEARTGYFEPRHCPRNQLIPFQIQRAHAAGVDVKEVALVDLNGTETDLIDFFRNSKELITGGWTNGPGGLQAYDTLTVNGNSRDLDSVIKTTTAAGDAGAETTTDFAVTEDERLFLEVELDINSGTAPKAVIIDAGDETTELSNTVQLTNGTNRFVFTITTTEATASLLLYNDTAAVTNFAARTTNPAGWISLTRTNWPTIYEFTSVDYIQYNGAKLRTSSLLSGRAWTNAGYDTFTTSDTAITSAIELGAAAGGRLISLGDIKLEAGDYIIYVPNVTINSGEAPSFRLSNGTWHASGYEQVSAGDNTLRVTVAVGGGTDDIVYNGYVQVINSAAANWSCGPVNVYKVSDLLPKGTYSLKLSDGTNTWYSEWFCIEDVYENGISVINVSGSSYETLATSGPKIISAINSAGTGQVLSDSIGSVKNGEEIIVITFLTLNSGELPSVRLWGTDVISNIESFAEGVNAITLTATQASDSVKILVKSDNASNFSTSEIWVRRQYDSRFIKIEFSNTTDLRGERSDNETILYQNSFSQQCWLKTILNTPSQKRVDVGDEKDGVFISEKISTQYLYRIVDYINRSLFEALIKLPQHDTITITDEAGNEYSPNVGNINVSIEWDTFDTGTLIIEFNDGSFVWTENLTNLT